MRSNREYNYFGNVLEYEYDYFGNVLEYEYEYDYFASYEYSKCTRTRVRVHEYDYSISGVHPSFDWVKTVVDG